MQQQRASVAQWSVGGRRVGADVCAWNVALDRIRVIVWSELEPRISLRKIHKEVKRWGSQGIQPILSQRLMLELLGLAAREAH